MTSDSTNQRMLVPPEQHEANRADINAGPCCMLSSPCNAMHCGIALDLLSGAHTAPRLAARAFL